LQKEFWVSRVIASKFDASTVYVTLNGYRWDNFDSYVYCSNNYGKTWTRIGQNLPSEPVNVIKEDADNKNILYLGTDGGVYVSIDKGYSFFALKGGLPYVPVHDLVLHPTAKELIIGTHGRSVYIADISLIQKFKSTKNISNLYIFDFENVNYNPDWGNRTFDWNYTLPKDLVIPFYSDDNSKVKLQILTKDSLIVFEEEKDFPKGINFFNYDLTVGTGFSEKYKESIKLKTNAELKVKDNKKMYLTENKYTVRISKNTGVSAKPFEVKQKRGRETQQEQGVPGEKR